jgi:hypothetical protein
MWFGEAGLPFRPALLLYVKFTSGFSQKHELAGVASLQNRHEAEAGWRDLR